MPSRADRFASSHHLTRGSSSRVGRAGFTLPEILIVIVMISVLALVAIPRFATGNSRRHMESARMRIAAAIATARQAAIQKGETVKLKIESNRVTVYTNSTPGTMLLSPVPLDTLYKVNVQEPAQPYTIDFSARGFANLGDETHIVLSRPGVSNDTVTVSRTGMVKR